MGLKHVGGPAYEPQRITLRGDDVLSNAGLPWHNQFPLEIYGDPADPPRVGVIIYRPAVPRPGDGVPVCTSLHNCFAQSIRFRGKFRVAPLVIACEQVTLANITIDNAECGVAQVLYTTRDYWNLGVPIAPTLTGGTILSLDAYGNGGPAVLAVGEVTDLYFLRVSTAGRGGERFRFHSVPKYKYAQWPEEDGTPKPDAGASGVPKRLCFCDTRMAEGVYATWQRLTRENDAAEVDPGASAIWELVPSGKFSKATLAVVDALGPAAPTDPGNPPAEPKDPPRLPRLHPSTPRPGWGLDVVTTGTPTRTIAGGGTSFPAEIRAGELWDVSGPPYRGTQGYVQLAARGTAESPARIRFGPGNRFAQKLYLQDAHYLVIEGLDAHKVDVGPRCDHIVFRGVRAGRGLKLNDAGELVIENGGGFSVAGSRTGGLAEQIAFINCRAEDCGNWLAERDEDVHGLTINGASAWIFALGCKFTHCSGNGVQVNAGDRASMAFLHHVVIGGCESWETKQAFLGVKQSYDVLSIGNYVHDQKPIGAHPSDWGAASGYQYDPERHFSVFNRFERCSLGQGSGSGSGGGDGVSVYVLGNFIRDCRHDPRFAYNANTSWDKGGISLVGLRRKYVVHNTITGCDAGIGIAGGERVHVLGNIVQNVQVAESPHLFIEEQPAELVEAGNLYGQAGGGRCWRRLGNQRSDLPNELVPLADGRPGLGARRWAPHAGVAEICRVFRDIWGKSLEFDIDGNQRPAGAWVVGAFER